MSIRSRIAIKRDDGTYKSIYCHSSGNLSHNGVILNNNYQDPTKVNLLMSLGDISILERHVFPDTTKQHDFNNPQCDVTIAYHRDRGEELNFKTHNNLEDLIRCSTDLEHLYLFENNEWKYADTMRKDISNINFYSLKEKLIENNLYNDKTNEISEVDSLAKNLMDYAKDFDPYDFNDCYNSYEDAFNYAKKDLLNLERAKSFIEMLGMDIIYMASEKGLDSPEMEDLSNRAFKLIKQVSSYCFELEKTITKDKDMDM